MNMAEAIQRDARQIILRALAARDNLTLNTTILDSELQRFGIYETRDWMHEQLSWLARIDAVTIAEQGSVRVVSLTDRGVEHVSGRRKIEGVGRPTLASLGVDFISRGIKPPEA